MREKDHPDITRRPDMGPGEAAHTIARAGLSAVPLVGGPASELSSAIITPLLLSRRDAWVEEIGQRLKELEESLEGFDVRALGSNDMFVTAVAQATHIALRNHQEEKLEALRNAVLNSALPSAPEEDIQLLLLNLIDVFTPSHLAVLGFFHDPQQWALTHEVTYPGPDPVNPLRKSYLSIPMAC